jgi:hypothetical protein
MLRQAVLLARSNPGTVIKLVGNENESEKAHNTMYALGRAKNVERRLLALGAADDGIVVAVGRTGARTVEVWVVAK